MATGDVEIEGRMPWSSNATFLATVRDAETEMPSIYKPHRGERGLWDFPTGLFRREVAAYVVSEALGWGIVPETVLRWDAPLGEGSLQRFVEASFDEHYFTLLEAGGHADELMRIAVFDLVINNADRKSGHCLLGADGRIWAIDHGVTFHTDPKLRTVIWDFAGDVVPAGLRDDIGRLCTAPPELTDLLEQDEVDAFFRRAGAVAELARFPDPGLDRRPYPWPLV